MKWLESLKLFNFFEENGQVCAAGWQKGDEGMVNTASGVASYLSKHADEL